MKQVFQLIDANIFRSRINEFIKREQQKSDHPLITISREYGSGGSVIAAIVADKLGKDWKVYHEEIVDEIAKETRLEKKLIREVDEKKIPLIEEIVDDFFGKRYVTLHNYTKSLVKILSTIGHRGNAIIVGRGANFLFPNALNIRIIADMQQRIKILMKYEGMNERQAVSAIEKRDKTQEEFIQTLYRHNPRKAHHYDIVIRISEHLDLDDAKKIVVNLAKRRFKL